MKEILIGSRAIKNLFPNFKREVKDWDYLVKEKPKEREKYTEYHVIPPLLTYIEQNNNLIDLDTIYTLKLSHIFWDIKWDKHIYDIVFLKSQGAKIVEKLFKELYDFWNTVHKFNRRTDFEKKNEDFFKDKVNRKYNHDALHLIINPYPIFETIKKNGLNAEISEELFNTLSQEQKLELVREESYVIALERYLIPQSITNFRIAYGRAIKALIQRLAPLWLAKFIVENYIIIIKPSYNFYQKFKEYDTREIPEYN